MVVFDILESNKTIFVLLLSGSCVCVVEYVCIMNTKTCFESILPGSTQKKQHCIVLFRLESLVVFDILESNKTMFVLLLSRSCVCAVVCVWSISYKTCFESVLPGSTQGWEDIGT